MILYRCAVLYIFVRFILFSKISRREPVYIYIYGKLQNEVVAKKSDLQ